MKRLIVLVMVVFVAGCHSFNGFNFFKSKTKKQAPAPKIITKHCKFKRFKEIVVRGNARVELVNGQYAVNVMEGHLGYSCQKGIDGQVLYIEDRVSNVYAKVSAPKLSMITVADNATISAKKFKTDALTVIAKGRGTIDLKGEFNIDKIIQYGKGRVNIDWVHDKALHVEGYDSGPICLAGRVGDMTVKIG